jgi:hypothetical protein
VAFSRRGEAVVCQWWSERLPEAPQRRGWGRGGARGSDTMGGKKGGPAKSVCFYSRRGGTGQKGGGSDGGHTEERRMGST